MGKIFKDNVTPEFYQDLLDNFHPYKVTDLKDTSWQDDPAITAAFDKFLEDLDWEFDEDMYQIARWWWHDADWKDYE